MLRAARVLLVPSVPVLVFLACFFVVLSTGPTWLFGDGDLGWHIQTGKLIEQTGRIPTCDVHSWTAPGVPWVDIEWLSNYLYWKTLQHLGFLGMLALEAAIIAAAFAILSHLMLAEGCDLLVTLGVSFWAFWLSSLHWFVRPHLRTWFFIALWSALLYAYLRTRTRWVWLVPATAVLWVTLHGGWPTGCITLALFAVGDVLGGPGGWTARNVKGWLAIGLVTLAATFLNPYGWAIHEDVVNMVNAKPVLDITQEWKSPDFRGGPKPFRTFFLVTLLAMAFLPAPRRAVGWGFLLWSTYMMMESVRHIPIFLVWMAPLTALGLTGLLRRLAEHSLSEPGTVLARPPAALDPPPPRWRGVTGLLLPVLALVLAVRGVFPPALHSMPAGFPADRFPTAAVEYLKAKPIAGNLLNDYTWGGYLTWALPDVRIFIDGRNVMYGAKLSHDWLTLATLAPGWKDLVASYGIVWTLFPTDAPLTQALRELGWQVRYSDSTATVLVRPGA
ncbi:MAG: hypothetical protein HY814_07660 [Candidatus Riflebacteria bacterium]|nr:hypothetical protein [Candidatus Riflebacteria bacterium]